MIIGQSLEGGLSQKAEKSDSAGWDRSW